MSGGNCPETPRQKMIGMMYLFLTAMLALNVSGELLQAFQLVDESIQESIKATDVKNKQLESQFEVAEFANPNKVKPVREKVNRIYGEADNLYNHIHELKLLMMRTADGSPEATLESYKGADNQDVAAQIMITEQNRARSIELKEKLNAYKDLLLEYVNPEDTALVHTITKSLSTEPKEPKQGQVQQSWESQKFEHLPLSASFALLSSIQSNIRNTQADITNYLLNSIDEGSFKFNKVEPIVIPRSEIVIKGGEYRAELLLAATDTLQLPEFNIEGHNVDAQPNGRGVLTIPANSLGTKSWKGIISMTGPDGQPRRYAVNREYEVIQPNVVISPTKMNVFYEALENPVEVSVPGISGSQLRVSFGNCTFRKRGDVFYVKPKSGFAGGKSVVSVSAEINGQVRRLGSQEFRIKPLPLPYATFAGKRDGKVRKNLLASQSGVFAEMGDDFDFELEYKVTQFSISTIKGGFFVSEASNSNRLTDAQQDLIKGTTRGAKINIEEIKAIGPDGRNRKLASIVLTVD
ncbi:gliding motility protein GldM [Carboxylicivirga mesophila]|uniref:Gliding motility protein GldM n=1 Tax=Carboxylicivirga mesophila TaxID=1166478 RepID=A0ABS5K6A2_9BACT|nr:gliding motility protein GldM [Carboxylicivirga mesophila]MBS2210053.1 gliding motility protein GldM [Carboxylicivirga mesophila]